MRMLREAWAESKTQRKNTKRRHKTGVLRKAGFELKPNHVETGGGRGGFKLDKFKNPRQGESLDKGQRQNKQYNYEQARSTRHAGGFFLLLHSCVGKMIPSWLRNQFSWDVGTIHFLPGTPRDPLAAAPKDLCWEVLPCLGHVLWSWWVKKWTPPMDGNLTEKIIIIHENHEIWSLWGYLFCHFGLTDFTDPVRSPAGLPPPYVAIHSPTHMAYGTDGNLGTFFKLHRFAVHRLLNGLHIVHSWRVYGSYLR